MSLQPRPADRSSTEADRRDQPPARVDFAQELARLARLAQSDYLA